VPAFKILNEVLATVGEILGAGLVSFKDFGSFIAKVVTTSVQPAIEAFSGLGGSIKGVGQALTGDFKGAGKTLKEALEAPQEAFEAMKEAPGEIKRAFDDLTADVKFNNASLRDDFFRRSVEITKQWQNMFVEIGAASSVSNRRMQADARQTANELENVWLSEKKLLDIIWRIPEGMERVAETSGRRVEPAKQTAKAERSVTNEIDRQNKRLGKQVELREKVSKSTGSSGSSVSTIRNSGDIAGLSTEKLEWLLQDTRDEIQNIKQKSRGSSFLSLFTSPHEIFAKNIEEELATRRRFQLLKSRSSPLLDAVFNPFQRERLNRVTQDQTDSREQTRLLEEIRGELETQTARTPLFPQ
jgi:hypothetical protein